MKRFPLSPFHYFMIGIIFLGILSVVWQHSMNGIPIAITIILMGTLVLLLLLDQEVIVSQVEEEQQKQLEDRVENSLANLINKIPIGIMKLNEETGQIDWYNPYAELIFAGEDGVLDMQTIQSVLESSQGEGSHYVAIGERTYAVHLDQSGHMVYFFDASSEYNAAEELATTRPVIGAISLDNYDDFRDGLSDSEVSSVNSFIADFVSRFADDFKMFYRRVDADRYYLFTDYTVLDQLMKDKFAIIDVFRSEAKEKNLPLTLSMGFAYGDGDHAFIGKTALENLNLALVRGGDQAVVRENREGKNPIYFGGGSVSAVKRTRTRTRAMMTAISDKIRSADQVFIVGHRNLDLDALGASVGMQKFAEIQSEQAYAVYDPTELAPDIERAIKSLQAEEKTKLLTLEEAMPRVTRQSLLIMVDHSKINLTLSKEFYEQFSQTIVIDHHRRDENFPENVVITYIESGASSACELVTELIQFQNAKSNRLSKIQASILMAGIMLDTKNFSVQVTNRTFDVASYLRSRGSDSTFIKEIMATDFEEYRRVNELILQGQRLSPAIVLAVAPENIYHSTIELSKAADTILSMSGIEVAFVMSQLDPDTIGISARSRSRINVQRIMEEMGGGGHFNLAAAQLRGVDLSMVTTRLKDVIINETQEKETDR
ncbi:DHH family phosphoesterase [Streptococcus sp. NLN64]|uniref:DHH family phosphoesterase n=1 Tax=Streptococcus sp. NLN64 TaxID=2822799 RepID=UPI0018CAC560|nr:DHH family phosphoesterase [Streptococcus sp. NLN64]MBG9368034.1 DHH family phosphoesterase [Streptococcus sp. NLN64]